MFMIKRNIRNSTPLLKTDNYIFAKQVAQIEANKLNEPVIIYSAKFEGQPMCLECIITPINNINERGVNKND